MPAKASRVDDSSASCALSNRWRPQCWIVIALTSCVLLGSPMHAAFGQQERKLVRRVEPVYPDLARQYRIKGTVRLRLLVARDGRVKSAQPLGGHPVLIEAVLNAVEKWKYDAAAKENEVIVEFKLGPDEGEKTK